MGRASVPESSDTVGDYGGVASARAHGDGTLSTPAVHFLGLHRVCASESQDVPVRFPQETIGLGRVRAGNVFESASTASLRCGP